MAMAGLGADDMDRYLEILRADPGELDLLSKDLLINVTSFFRDPKVFELLAERVIPGLIRDRAPDQPMRIWIAGCSTGEETYSLAMLFREAITAAKRNVKLQVFASDVDPDAVASRARGALPGHHRRGRVVGAPLALLREGGARLPDLARAARGVVFTVQDVLADPPFSRLDLVSCRNLLIYLRPEAQAKVISLFHFALREGGILLLGSCGDDRQHARANSSRSPSRSGSIATSAARGRANSVSCWRRRRHAGCWRGPGRARCRRARPCSPSCAGGWCSRPTRRRRC